jgi:DNA mismatch endonuclease (patch repair protein)
MSGNRSKDTSIKRLARRALRDSGISGCRLNWSKLLGKPDIVFAKQKLAIFVNGCYWHRHDRCKLTYMPKSNTAYWSEKFVNNVERDSQVLIDLQQLGWKTLVIWECEVRSGRIDNRVLMLS